MEIKGTDGGRTQIAAPCYILATGSRPRSFPGVTVDQQRILDSDGVLNLTAFPRRLVIIGAGIIGCEYATIFSNFGQTRVYLVDYADRVIPYEDEDISAFVSSKLADNGVTIYHSAALRSIAPRQGHLEVVLDFDAGYSEVVEADAALIAIGREPNLQTAGLEKAGVSLDARGYLERDKHGRVAENIYAVGDLGRHPALVNIAETEARYAVEHIFGLEQRPPNFNNMSTVMFFRPAVAAVGLNEKGCQKRGIAYRVARYSNALLPRAIAMRALDGFVKIIAGDAAPQPILGMRAAGPQASNTIMAIAMLMDQGRGIADMLKVMYPHPTMSEGIQECLRLLAGNSIYKRQAFPKHIQIRRWCPQTGYED
jgi:dihydrolipoamide dehydrogenase